MNSTWLLGSRRRRQHKISLVRAVSFHFYLEYWLTFQWAHTTGRMQLLISIGMCISVCVFAGVGVGSKSSLVESALCSAHNASFDWNSYFLTIIARLSHKQGARSPHKSKVDRMRRGHSKAIWRKEEKKTKRKKAIYSLKHVYGSAALVSTLDWKIGLLPSLSRSLAVSAPRHSFALIFVFIYFCYRHVWVDFCFDSRSNYRSFTWLTSRIFFVRKPIGYCARRRAIRFNWRRCSTRVNEHYFSFSSRLFAVTQNGSKYGFGAGWLLVREWLMNRSKLRWFNCKMHTYLFHYC